MSPLARKIDDDAAAGQGRPDRSVSRAAPADRSRDHVHAALLELQNAFEIDADQAALCALEFIARLRQIASAASRTQTSSRTALAPHQHAKVCALVENALHRPIGAADMAACVNLSLSHFARAFATSQGMPPYAYLLEQRLARAERLLRETDAPLVQIALDCGFGAQSSLTRAFTRSRKISPGAWRAARRAQIRGSVALLDARPRPSEERHLSSARDR